MVRVLVEDGAFRLVRMAAGGVAPVPLRFPRAEAIGEGAAADADTIARMARAAVAGASPLPMTGYKLDLLQGLIKEVLE